MTSPSAAASFGRRSPRAWRLYLVTGLAGTYLLAWRAVGGLTPSTTSTAPGGDPPEPAGTEPARTAEPARTVWLEELPASARPPVALPSGWQLATRRPTTAPPPRLIQAPARRPLRVRTRSS